MIPSALQLLDVLLIVLAAFCAHVLSFDARTEFTDIQAMMVSLAVAVALVMFPLFGVYQMRRRRSLVAQLIRTLLALAAVQSLMIVMVFSTRQPAPVSRGWIVVWCCVAAAWVTCVKISIRVVSGCLRGTAANPRAIAIAAGATEVCRMVERVVLARHAGFKPVVVFDARNVDGKEVMGVPVTNRLDRFIETMRRQRVRELWIVGGPGSTQPIESFVDALRHDFVDIRFFPDLGRLGFADAGVVDLLGLPAINVVASPVRGMQVVPKAIFDRVFAAFALLVSAPLMLAIACAVKASSPGPVFFRQWRQGADGAEFSIYKFRTMRQHVEQAGLVTQAKKDDPRVTKVGAFLRRTSLDELPQFINVLRGEMSVVGPRPHATEHDELYKHLVDNYMYRYRIKPGITGWAQVNGCRGETDGVVKMANRVELDLYYIRNWTFWFDLKIVFLTVLRGVASANAY